MTNENWVEVAIGLGSNLNQPADQIHQACSALKTHPTIQNFILSDLYTSRPQGPQDQPDFINAAARFKTSLAPLELLQLLQQLEQQQGRVKHRHWGERVIDLDILLYGDQQLELPGLVVPHVQMTLRDFVLLPLNNIWPDATIPGKGVLSTYIAQLPEHFLIKNDD